MKSQSSPLTPAPHRGLIRSIFAVGILAFALFVVGTKVLQFKAMAAGGPMAFPPSTVTSAEAKTQDWQPTLSTVGSLTAVQGVMVAAELPGKVTKINFESGAMVKAGDILLEQDTSFEQAQLRASEAAANLAKINLERSKSLLASATISQLEFDTMDAQSKQATAQLENIRANLAKKQIHAPFAGKLGIRQVNLGQSLKEGDVIVSLQSADPIYVNFNVPQQNLAVLSEGLPIRITSDSLPDKVVEGKINAVNPDVDSSTRNVRVQATVSNPSGELHPGVFVNVDVALATHNQVLAIPATSVLYAPYGNSVFVIEDKKDEKGQASKTIRQQFVRLGEARGDFVQVLSGLKEGDSVVSTGVFKLRTGMPVAVNNSLSPQFQLNPKPRDS